MKKSKFVVSIMVLVLCTAFISCKQEKKDAPTIKITYNGEVKTNGETIEANVGEEVTITAEYDAQGYLEAIRFLMFSNHQAFLGHVFASPAYFGKKNTSHKVTETVKFEHAGEVQIEAHVMDCQKEALSSDFKMTVNVK